MKVVILAGGLGSRLSEETDVKPKPMVEIGGIPILVHIMNIYSAHGLNDFIICLGYKGYIVKEYFTNYVIKNSDFTVNLRKNEITYHDQFVPPWTITLVDTGIDSMTGGRLKRVGSYLDPDEPFCMTYGDGLSNIDIAASVAFHRQQGKLATVTAVRAPARFGALELKQDVVTRFREKQAKGHGDFINGGFFVLSPAVLDYIEDDLSVWETDCLPRMAKEDQLSAWRHDGFWQPMDTLRERNYLNDLWNQGEAPWHIGASGAP
jgi:glucose-1-phosphate cytidylyltransferase